MEFTLDKIEERYRESAAGLDTIVKRQFKGLSLRWIEVEDAIKLT